MRPLIPEEIARARKVASRFWWRLSALVLPQFLFLFLLVYFVEDEPLGHFLTALFGLLLLVTVPSVLTLGWGIRKWRQEFMADLADGVVDQKTGKIFDRFKLTQLFGPSKHVIWIEGVDLPVDICVDRSQLASFRIGDMVCVDFLPRSGIVLGIQKI